MFGFFMKKIKEDKNVTLANWLFAKAKEMESKGNTIEAKYLEKKALQVLASL